MKFDLEESVLLGGIDRARRLCGIEEYLTKTHGGVLDYSDVLRSAVMLGLSSFDMFMHQLVREACLACFASGKLIRRLNVPIQVFQAPPGGFEAQLRDYLDETNSYKSFVAPDKVAEALSAFLENPWSKISQKLGKSEKEAKDRLRVLVDWRNRIAHSADINPNLGGIELWPVVREDVIGALDDLASYGNAIRSVIEEACHYK